MKLKKSQTLNLAHKGPNFFLRKKKQIEIFGNLTQDLHMPSEALWNMSPFVSLFSSVLALLASFRFYYLLFYFICVGVLPVYMTVHDPHAWCPQRPEECIGSPGTGDTGSSNCHVVLGLEAGSSRRAPISPVPC